MHYSHRLQNVSITFPLYFYTSSIIRNARHSHKVRGTRHRRRPLVARTLNQSVQSNSKQASTQAPQSINVPTYECTQYMHAFTKTLQKDSQLLASMDAASVVVVAAALDRPAACSFASSSFVAVAVVAVEG